MDFINIFQSLAYPVAVSVILFIAGGYFAKRILAQMHERETENNKLRDQYIEYLQKSNAELTGAIRENATAFNRFSETLSDFKNVLKDFSKPG
jgi:hypothetical protein